MTRSTKRPPGRFRPPEWLKMPRWLFWGGHTHVVHLTWACPNAEGRNDLMLKVNPEALDWNRIHLCRPCVKRAWKELK